MFLAKGRIISMFTGGPYEERIPWRAPISAEVSPEMGQRLARSWRHRMWNEAGAHRAFLALAELAAQSGAPATLVSEMRESAADEINHAETCRAMISRFSGEPDPPPPDPFPALPLDRYTTAEDRALHGVILMSCISETIGCPFQQEIADTATDPAVRAAQEIFFGEELRHGRFGWAYVAFEAKRAPDRVARLQSSLPPLIDLYARGLPEIGSEKNRDLEPYGILSSRHTHRVFRDALHELIIPGFEAFGLELSAVGNKYPLEF